MGKVLVVEDEPITLKLTEEIFEVFGIDAAFTSNGKEGLNLFKKSPTEFSMILLDMKLPEMTGREFYTALNNSSVQVVIASGFREQDVMPQFIGNENVSFIQKPYSVRELVKKISSQNAMASSSH